LEQVQDLLSRDNPGVYRFQGDHRTRICRAGKYSDVAKGFNRAQEHHGLLAPVARHARGFDPACFQDVDRFSRLAST